MFIYYDLIIRQFSSKYCYKAAMAYIIMVLNPSLAYLQLNFIVGLAKLGQTSISEIYHWMLPLRAGYWVSVVSMESDRHSASVIILLYALSYEKLIMMILKCTNKTLIQAWISNNIHYKVWDEITYPFPNFNDATVEVWEWISNFFSHFIMFIITYPCWD